MVPVAAMIRIDSDQQENAIIFSSSSKRVVAKILLLYLHQKIVLTLSPVHEFLMILGNENIGKDI